MLKIPQSVQKVVAPRLLLKDTEVAQRLECSRRHVWSLLSQGKICPPIHLGRLVRWRSADIDAWVAGLPHMREVELSTPRRGRPRARMGRAW